MIFLKNHLSYRISVALIGVGALLSASLVSASNSNCTSCTFTCSSYAITDSKSATACSTYAEYLSAGATVGTTTIAVSGWYQCYVASNNGTKTCEVSLGNNTAPTATCVNSSVPTCTS